MPSSLKRRELDPLAGDATTLERVVEHLRAWRADTADTIERLRAHRIQIDEHSRQLENPRAALEYLEFFTGFFERAIADLERIAAELPQGAQPAHLDALRQIASNSAAEQRRCVQFRDRWINKPLPFEQQRPLLNAISTDTRDQLLDYRELASAAARLAELAAADPSNASPRPPADLQSPDRRALFTRWFGR
jgi:hypothetical protein